MSKIVDNLRVDEIIMRQRDDGGEDFPVAIISGLSLQTSATSGNQSISKRKVSLPLNGLSLEEARASIPAIRQIIEGRYIESYEVPPYEWTTPDGEIRVDNVRYRLNDPSASEPASEPESSRKAVEEPAPQVQKAPPTEIGTDAKA